MAITTKDLAKLCGVSRTTIHRALNGTGRINPETKELILRVAKENDYRPDLLATGLAKGQTYNIGVVVLDVKNRYFAQMLSTISTEAYKRGYGINITIHTGSAITEMEQLTRLADYRVDGIILSSVHEGKNYVKFLQDLNRPVVTVDNKLENGFPFVGIDQRTAMKDAAKKVIVKGYEQIIFMCPPLDKTNKQNLYVHSERLKGFIEEMKAHPEIKADTILSWDYLDKVDEVLQGNKRTAFLCTSDEYALEIMKMQKMKGRKTPKDYGIMGFDNIDTLDYITPRLTTISNSVDEVAISAVKMLFDLIEKRQDKQESDQTNEEINSREIILQHKYMEGETI